MTQVETHPPTTATTLEPKISWRQLIGIPLNVALFLLLMVMAWGSWSGFFAHPARTGVVMLHLAMKIGRASCRERV